MTPRRETYDYRRAPWMPSRSRDETFDRLRELARAGKTCPQIAAHLGASYDAVRCYLWRYGITMAELREGEQP